MTGFARGGTFAALGTGSAAVLGFVLTLVVTHGLTTTSAGQFFTVTATFIVLQTFLSFGVGAGLVRFVPRFRALDRANDIPALLVSALGPVVAFGIVGSVALWFAAPLLASRVGLADTAAVLSSVRLLALLLLPGTLEIAVVECTRAMGSTRKYVLVQQLAVPAARPVLVGIAIAVHSPLWVVMLAWVTPLVLALVLSGHLVGRSLKALFGRSLAWPPRSTSVRHVAVEYWKFTGARGVASVMEILLTWLDVLLVAALVSPAQAAIYAAASRFITSGTLVLQALRLAIAGDVSAALARGDTHRVSQMYSVASQWVVVSSWPLYLLVAVFASTVLRVFGSSYPAGAHALTVLCLAMLVTLATGNVGTVLLMGGRSHWVLLDKGASLAVNVVANLLLVPAFGITGAAIAWALSIMLDSGLAFGQVRWGMGIGASLRGLAFAGLLALGCFGLVPAVVRAVGGSSIWVMAGAVVLALGLYAPIVWLRRDSLGIDVLIQALTPRRRAAGRAGDV